MSVFGPRQLLDCYQSGIFPMAESRDSPTVFFVDPEYRGILPLEASPETGGMKISRSLAKTVRQRKFEIRINTAFEQVVSACAAPRQSDSETWINAGIEYLYGELHKKGHAHTVECWQGDTLVGGLYGVHIGAAFFGESMFSHVRDASKVALVHLVGRLKAGGFTLLDMQFLTPHLERLGGVEIPRKNYQDRLSKALKKQGDYFPSGFSDSGFAAGIRQSKTQIS